MIPDFISVKKYYRPADVTYFLGDATKAKEKLGWEPSTNFDELIAMMAESDIKYVKNYIKLK